MVVGLVPPHFLPDMRRAAVNSPCFLDRATAKPGKPKKRLNFTRLCFSILGIAMSNDFNQEREVRA
jgi:hypothetical protein